MTYTATDFRGTELELGDTVIVTGATGIGLPYGVPIRFQMLELEIVQILHNPDTHDRLYSNAKLVLRDADRSNGLTLPAELTLKA